MERRTLPQPADIYTADQAAVVVTALVSQIYATAAELAEHLLVLQEHRYADRP
ncbi:hypothetical protein ACFU6I_47255 [Streptomyces sp. NPDC057486]|uniref:hypothetical protein n=1 Tax=Streptomyces sp. NPDC057486 TaxID=3346145 RepID=UPI0036AC03B7